MKCFYGHHLFWVYLHSHPERTGRTNSLTLSSRSTFTFCLWAERRSPTASSTPQIHGVSGAVSSFLYSSCLPAPYASSGVNYYQINRRGHPSKQRRQTAPVFLVTHRRETRKRSEQSRQDLHSITASTSNSLRCWGLGPVRGIF